MESARAARRLIKSHRIALESAGSFVIRDELQK